MPGKKRRLRLIPDNEHLYSTVIDQVSAPGEPDQFYWHLYYEGGKVNGGIADHRAHAEIAAESARHSHNYFRWQEENVWDLETQTWISRSELGIGLTLLCAATPGRSPS